MTFYVLAFMSCFGTGFVIGSNVGAIRSAIRGVHS